LLFRWLFALSPVHTERVIDARRHDHIYEYYLTRVSEPWSASTLPKIKQIWFRRDATRRNALDVNAHYLWRQFDLTR